MMAKKLSGNGDYVKGKHMQPGSCANSKTLLRASSKALLRASRQASQDLEEVM
jgi:hypothetical protein